MNEISKWIEDKVDWTQKTNSKQKHRMIISGVGTEPVYKLKPGIS